MRKLIVLLLGWAFIVLGVIGLFLPVLQGILFLVIGLTILSSEYAWAHHLLQKARNRFPIVALRCEEAAHKTHSWLQRIFVRNTSSHNKVREYPSSHSAEAYSSDRSDHSSPSDDTVGMP
jgi:uncharacterized protein